MSESITTNMLPVYEWLHGRSYTLDDVEGTFVLDIRQAKYPREETICDFYHEATDAGKISKEYQRMKAQLHDDYVTTPSIERILEIAHELGYSEPIGEPDGEETQ